MPTHVALLRGINLGPHKRVAMPALRALVEGLGHTDVATYIASGNVVFSSKGAKGLDRKIAAALEKALGHEVPVFVRTIDEVVAAAAHAPFPEKDVALFPTYLVGFLSKELDAAGLSRLKALETDADRFHVRECDFWWLSKHHQARPAITGRQLEKALGQPTTLRNVNTIRRMAERYGALIATSRARR